MKMVTEGVMEGNLPWNLVFIGVFLALMIEVIGIPVLPFAIGLYLPIYLSTPIMVGGLIKLIVTKRKNKTEEEIKEDDSKGILYSSGLIAVSYTHLDVYKRQKPYSVRYQKKFCRVQKC